MKRINPTKYILLFLFFFFCFHNGNSQSLQKKYPFIKENQNVIYNTEELNSFFSALKQSDKRIVNILHIGDSHLQSNQITEVLRNAFQNQFGNAGRGLIVPYKVAGTNSPEDIISYSDSKWEGKRNCKPLLPQSTGIGGITIESVDSTASFSFRLPEKYAFTQMTVFFENDGKSYDLKVKDLQNGEVINLQDFISSKDKNTATIKFKNPTNEAEIYSLKTDPSQTHTTILGINTQNDQKGIIYHSIGVNGAEYFHYDTSEYFNEETPFLQPDLFIISLGTNEAYRKDADFNDATIKQEIDRFITNLKKYNPETPFLITTPAYAYKNKKYQNSRLKIIHDLLVSYCQENNLAYWDLQEITGGAANWKNYNLFSKDLVHFNKNGYQLQGNLLLNALLNAYNEYVANN